LEVNFHFEDISFELLYPEKIKSWISEVIQMEKKECGIINCIFCSDSYLLEINEKYLNHNYFTDIITFDYVVENQISGDLFISFERVKENALKLSINLDTELKRVIIHGVLHLLGYGDKTDQEALEIRAKEDFYLNLQASK